MEIDPSVICAAIAAAGTIVCAMISKKTADGQKKAEEKATLRERESRLSLALMYANTQATEALVIAMQNGHNNGNVEIARENMTKAMSDYDAFHKEIVAKEIAK